jgi:hypothetical protein
MAGWHSSEWSTKIGKVREPTLLEYFATTALDTLAQTTIREAIQNSLDAAIKVKGVRQRPVRVRIFVSGSKGALSAQKAGRWFGGLFPHLKAQKKGPRNLPSEVETCPYFTFEDFNTRGLYGAYDRNHAEDGEDNAWVYFFHKEGDTSKQESDRGRWGVGKVVFPGASRIHTFLAYTVREDAKRLMMGQAMLRSRTVSEQKYLPDAWYGHQATNERPPMPLEDESSINEFREAFNLKRDRESGLSIVVPYVEEGDPEGEDPGITFETVADAVIADYFLPILRGDLVVELASPDGSIEIDKGSLPKLAGERLSPLVLQRRHEISLAVWSVNGSVDHTTIGKHSIKSAIKWEESLISEDQRDALRKLFEAGKPIAVQVPVQIRLKGNGINDSYFDVYLQNTGEPAAFRPLFVREGLIIPDVKGGRARGVRSLVVAQDGGIATLLGDAENPAHTEWQPKSSNFKEKYLFGPSYLRFVMESVEAIVRRIANDPAEEDTSVLLDVFSLPAEEDDGGKTKRRRSKPKGKDSGDPPVLPPAKPKRFRIDKSSGGFVIRPGDAHAARPRRLVVRAAYDLRSGDPFAKWNAEDFQLASLACKCTDAISIEMDGNRMVFEISGPAFEIPFEGFDERRDVRVDVRVQEVADEADA